MSKNFTYYTYSYTFWKPHVINSSIIADIFARFKRLEVLRSFLDGTDEHGLKIQREAEKKE